MDAQKSSLENEDASNARSKLSTSSRRIKRKAQMVMFHS